jgi:hypothetical protein
MRTIAAMRILWMGCLPHTYLMILAMWAH